MLKNAKVGEQATALAAKAPAVPADRAELVENKAKAEAVVTLATAICQKAMYKPMTTNIARKIATWAKKNAEDFAKLAEECVTAKVEAEKRAAALEKAKLDMSMEKQ